MKHKLTDAAAFMTGQVTTSGDMHKLDVLAPVYEQLMRALQEETAESSANEDDSALDRARDQADEEAIAMLKPAMEPRNPCSREFWQRHIGTDMLVSTWLLLFSGTLYVGIEIYKVYTSSACMYGCLSKTQPKVAQVNNYAQLVSAVLMFISSAAFLYISYPEEFAAIVVRTSKVEPDELPFLARYFTQNELLQAMWCLLLSALPLVFASVYMVVQMEAWYDGYLYLLWALGVVAMLGVWTFACMPHNMKANGGAGSSVFHDYVVSLVVSPCCGAACQEAVKGHLGSDFLVGSWSLLVGSLLFSVITLVNTVATYQGATYDDMALLWTTFLMGVFMMLGSALVVLTSYPENMNSTRVWSYFAGVHDAADSEQPEIEPLLRPPEYAAA